MKMTNLWSLPRVRGLVLLGCINLPLLSQAAERCFVHQEAQRVELHSPHFIFRLDTASGLRADSWENRLTGKKVSLGNGPEMDLDLGPPGGSPPALSWLAGAPKVTYGEAGEAVFSLTSKESALSATVTYRWNATEPVLRKTVQIKNEADREQLLLNVRLGAYGTDARAEQGDGERGFPVYLNDQFFLSLAHPSGWAVPQQNQVLLKQYPGTKLAPGKTFECMEAVLGVAEEGQARRRFVEHVRSRMRRVVRGHDKPYAIFEPFGARPGGDNNFDETEAFLLDNLAKVEEGMRDSGCRFDFYSIDFWVDFHGDLKRTDPQRFPNGFTKILPELKRMGMLPGLWIDSSWGKWSIGGNPAAQATYCQPNQDPLSVHHLTEQFCRASEPIRSLYTAAFRHHLKENGVRLVKFDNLRTNCAHPQHAHLPGPYSTEAIHNAVIETLKGLDEESPDVFLMLYWGHRSPWWLLHADTYFETGMENMEGASYSSFPAPYARDSITQRLDQAQWNCRDTPWIGKDSLGIWLSDWSWNSKIGKEHWPEGFVMDMGRGGLLPQVWSDTAWLSPPERKQMGEFIALMKARPECFAHSRFVLGNPWKDEPYGYCCSDGKRAFLALYNCAWKDSTLALKLNSTWGLPDARSWDLYRWYPRPARLRENGQAVGAEASITLRPFETVLLEAVPKDEAPALKREFADQALPHRFEEPSRQLEWAITRPEPKPEPKASIEWSVLEPLSAVSAGGATLTLQKDGAVLASGENPPNDTYSVKVRTELKGITALRLEVLTDKSLPNEGPGRAENGNFALTEIRWASAEGPVALHRPAADFAQESYGGWPIAAALDGDPKTAWSVDPEEGRSHTAIFETAKPLDGKGELQVTLVQGDRCHSLGRFRFSATNAKPPIPAPTGSASVRPIVRAQIPASRTGGLLCLVRTGQPIGLRGKVGDKETSLQPIERRGMYPCTWQGWRVRVESSTAPQEFELIEPVVRSKKDEEELQKSLKIYFIPD